LFCQLALEAAAVVLPPRRHYFPFLNADWPAFFHGEAAVRVAPADEPPRRKDAKRARLILSAQYHAKMNKIALRALLKRAKRNLPFLAQDADRRTTAPSWRLGVLAVSQPVPAAPSASAEKETPAGKSASPTIQ
jgi:hypothetical protein